jgi:hypothetical protein
VFTLELWFVKETKFFRALNFFCFLVADLTSEFCVKAYWLDTNRNNQITMAEIIIVTKKNTTYASTFLSPQIHPYSFTKS